ncbi:MAG: aminopeptidase, partial [Proteobacteria bacterium]|nr:aminopeptidase [Pseudomonadota bacterium]
MNALPFRPLTVLVAALLLGGCAQPGVGLGYYWQSLHGHVALLQAARPVQQWLDSPDTPAPLRARLELAQQARAFAVTDLGLPDNASYHRYARLERKAAVWNVVAAGPYSLELHRWCFPVAGCVGYRGYFAEADARAEAARLAATGLEVNVYGVPAYSTLGYSNWLGGDPLLSTFIAWPEGDFVRLLFHELAHQQV